MSGSGEVHSNFWKHNSKSDVIKVICLVPKYEILKINMKASNTFKDLKALAYQRVCEQLRRNPEENFDSHNIFYVSDNTFYQEIENYELKIKDIDFFLPVFKFINPSCDKAQNENLSTLLTKFNIDLHYLEDQYPDLYQQRIALNNYTYNLYKEINECNFDTKFSKIYPQIICKVDSLSTKYQSMIVNIKNIKIQFYFNYIKNDHRIKMEKEIEIAVACDISTLKNTLKKAVNEKYKLSSNSNHIIKMVGKEMYFTGVINSTTSTFDENTRLIDYVEIQNMIFNSEDIILTLVEQKNELIETNAIVKPLQANIDTDNKIERVNVWNDEKCDTFKILIKYLNFDNINYYMLKLGLFYGDILLTGVVETPMYSTNKSLINSVIDFKISLLKLPVNTKICVVLYGSKNKIGNEPKPKYMNPIAWINFNIYDFNGFTGESQRSVNMHTSEIKRLYHGLNPLGTTLPPNSEHSTFRLSYQFSYNGQNFYYPKDKQIKSAITKKEASKRNTANQNELSDVNFFQEMSEWVTFGDLTQEQKEKLWAERELCLKKHPNLMPKILSSIPDYSKRNICKAMMLLKKPTLLKNELSLELLQIKYCHPSFRSYLVKNLEQFSDEKLELYMTQIVEALKYEQHIYCELTLFLLKRSMNNRRVAHYFLWNLIADAHNPELCIRNGFIIEAYCRVNPTHLDDIIKQMEMMSKLRHFYQVASVNNVTDKNSLLELFKQYLSFKAVIDVFNNLSSPLDPVYSLKSLILEECKVMESKKKPLLLVFRTDDVYSTKVRILYKYGDDLRQDILVITCLKIINNLCINLDPYIRFSCYNVLNTGDMEGMIQLVEDATTLATIQAKRGFKQQTLHEWYIDQLKDDKKFNDTELEQGCKRFASTCAGYSVMTYILGIGDRHNDNIMIHKSGRIFHIDFGHILGNFKSFYGIKRERTAFIMTKDFLYFANNSKVSKSDTKQYRDYCSEIFVLIRDSSYLIFLPFLLMIHAGLPELTSESDISYIVNALDFRLEPMEAKRKFEEKFTEACDKSWSTELNFMAHNMRIAGSAKKKETSDISKIVFK